eukprot:gnl/TRDRNA2_/TRDRNA2_196369_c0_seq1.p1 gnl/TRDRNA2_/TRDRNA2_196369_c0~~gnl/TRDRNA2_/TRDRNA2_196369_c0_seq1.p1  ORF type:complete len:544 (-),score=74.40 gnl/TRDRNA2_/TRDRNA2_196369_c0_seq1:39-1454(-)
MGSQDLFDAAIVGDAKRMRWALQAHANPNAGTDPVGLTALHICASQGHVKAAQVLVEHKADPSAKDNRLGKTPLSLASSAGQLEAVRFLIFASAKIDGPEGDGGAPLLHAALRNFPEVCEALVTAGANSNAAFRRSKDPAFIRDCLEHHHSTTASWRSVLYGERRASSELLQVEGVTPLHLGALHGSGRICRCLLSAGTRVNAVDALSRNPLLLGAENGHVEVVSLLLEHGAANAPDFEGQTAGTLAARGGYAAVLQALLSQRARGVKPAMSVDDVVRIGGVTVLHVAVHYGHAGSVSLLCENDANVCALCDPGGVVPLMVAAGAGHDYLVRELLAYGARVNDVDSEGKTAWVYAVEAGHSDICNLLASFGATEMAVASHQAVPAADVAGGSPTGTSGSRGYLAKERPGPVDLNPTGLQGCGAWQRHRSDAHGGGPIRAPVASGVLSPNGGLSGVVVAPGLVPPLQLGSRF